MTGSVTDRIAAFEAQAATQFPAEAMAVFGGERQFRAAESAARCRRSALRCPTATCSMRTAIPRR